MVRIDVERNRCIVDPVIGFEQGLRAWKGVVVKIKEVAACTLLTCCGAPGSVGIVGSAGLVGSIIVAC